MKISYITTSSAPSSNASSLQSIKMCEAFSFLGNKVTLLLPNTGLKTINLKKFYNIKSNFRIIRLKRFTKFPIGINYYLYAFLSVIQALKLKSDLIITRNFMVSIFLIFFKKKHILEIHDTLSIEGRIINFVLKNFKILNSSYLLKIVTTTQTLKQSYLRNCGIMKKKIYVLHNCSSLKFKKKNFFFNKKRFNIGYFGSTYKSRGVNLITKLSLMDKENNYFIYGWSQKNKSLRKKNSLNLFNKKYISYSNIQKEISKMDCLILPYTDRITVAGDVGNIANYTSPLKMFDYLVSGKIIISSELRVLKEVLVDKKNCLFIKDFNNPHAWKNKINFIKGNDKLLRILKKNTFNNKKYSCYVRAKKFLDI